MRVVQTFSFDKDMDEPKEPAMVTVKPTPGWILYSIYSSFGRLLQVREHKKKK